MVTYRHTYIGLKLEKKMQERQTHMLLSFRIAIIRRLIVICIYYYKLEVQLEKILPNILNVQTQRKHNFFL